MNSVTLLTGGSRSGKSRRALEMASEYNRKAFIATAEPIDDEMDSRISAHRRERGDSFITVEEPVYLACAITSLQESIEVAIIDCLTVWLGNLMYHIEDDNARNACIEAFLTVLRDPPCNLLIVTNEVGMGIIPSDRMTREYRDLAGSLNQQVSAIANRVVFMVSGLPLVLKDEKK